MKTKLMISVAGLIVGLAAACGSDSTEPTTSPNDTSGANETTTAVQTVDFESCSGLLDLDHVRDLAGRSDVELGDTNVNSGAAEPNDVGMETMCIYEFITPEIIVGGPTDLRVSGPSMTLSGILFDSEESAATHYQFSLDNLQLMQDVAASNPVITEGSVGEESYLFSFDAEGIGSMIGLRVGSYVLSLHTTLPDDHAPLVDSQVLVLLASNVRDQLADS